MARGDTGGPWRRAFIGLGSNLGDRRARIDAALEWLAGHERIRLGRHTEPIETPPWGVVEQPGFLNAVAEVTTSLAPEELLDELKRAERALGRTASEERWGPREIDLDILLFGDVVVECETLTVPHA